MDLRLKGKNALVFASSQGLGLTVAKHLAAESCNVVLCSRSDDKLEKAKNAVLDINPDIDVFSKTVNLAEPKDVKMLMEWTINKFKKKLHILITNTGGPPTKKFLETQLKEWDQEHKSILLSVIIGIKYALPIMLAQEWGRIITITSLTVHQPLVNFSFSNAYRASIVSLVKTIALEYSSTKNFCINNVCPGYTMTDRVKNIVINRSKEEKRTKDEILAEIEESIPKGRLASVEEFADLVTFLASEKSSYITGKSIAIDGGFVKGLLL